MKRINELEAQLQAEKSKIEALEADSCKLFEAEETLVKLREENETFKNEIVELKNKSELAQLAPQGWYKKILIFYKNNLFFIFIRTNQIFGSTIKGNRKTT